MKVLFAGDTHGDLDHCIYLIEEALDAGAEAIFQVGDFGFWPHTPWGEDFLKGLDANLAFYESIPWYWIDGNHENFDVLDVVRGMYPEGLVPTPTSLDSAGFPTNFSDSMTWVPRGEVLTLGKSRVMGFGGGYSIDRDSRTPGRSWWPQETIKPWQVGDVEPQDVDVLVTHEVPHGFDPADLFKFSLNVSVDQQQRELVTELVDKIQPGRVICGHHHVRLTWKYRGTQVDVLDRDGTKDRSFIVLDL